MFSENMLKSYQQDLQLVPYFVKMITGDRLKFDQIFQLLFCKTIIVAQIHKVVYISENL